MPWLWQRFHHPILASPPPSKVGIPKQAVAKERSTNKERRSLSLSLSLENIFSPSSDVLPHFSKSSRQPSRKNRIVKRWQLSPYPHHRSIFEFIDTGGKNGVILFLSSAFCMRLQCSPLLSKAKFSLLSLNIPRQPKNRSS